MKFIKITLSMLFLGMGITSYTQGVIEYKVVYIEHYLVDNATGIADTLSNEYPADFIVVWFNDAMIFAQNNNKVREYYIRAEKFHGTENNNVRVEKVMFLEMENNNGNWTLVSRNNRTSQQPDGGIISYEIGNNYLDFNYDYSDTHHKYKKIVFSSNMKLDDYLAKFIK